MNIGSRHKMLITWIALSLVWLSIAWKLSHIERAVDAYRSISRYENRINHSGGDSYYRSSYMRSTDRAEKTNKYILHFLLVGFIPPWVTLALWQKLHGKKEKK